MSSDRSHSRGDPDPNDGDPDPNDDRPEPNENTVESVDQTGQVLDSDQTDTERAPKTLLNALIGAVLTVVTALFVPLSPVLGGAVAGYLEGADAESGLRVGALSGAIALVPLLVIVPLGLVLFIFEPIAAIGVLVIIAAVIGFLGVYTVGFGALGGLLGVYLYREFGSKRG